MGDSGALPRANAPDTSDFDIDQMLDVLNEKKD